MQTEDGRVFIEMLQIVILYANVTALSYCQLAFKEAMIRQSFIMFLTLVEAPFAVTLFSDVSVFMCFTINVRIYNS